MKRLFFALTVLLIATPMFAQDEGGGGGGAFAGGGGNQVFTRIDAVNPMEPVKAFLQSKANITLSADQEKTLRPQVEAAFQQIRDLSERGQSAGRLCAVLRSEWPQTGSHRRGAQIFRLQRCGGRSHGAVPRRHEEARSDSS